MTDDAVSKMAAKMAEWATKEEVRAYYTWGLGGISMPDNPIPYVHAIRQAILKTRSFEDFRRKLWMSFVRIFKFKMSLDNATALYRLFEAMVADWRELYAEAVFSTDSSELGKEWRDTQEAEQ